MDMINMDTSSTDRHMQFGILTPNLNFQKLELK